MNLVRRITEVVADRVVDRTVVVSSHRRVDAERARSILGNLKLPGRG
jgi:hypothetical protein